MKRVTFLFVLLVCAAAARAADDDPGKWVVRRFAENPIIRPAMIQGKGSANINGPSLIRVPAWVPNPLGKYYLYFASHHGGSIRLAYADRLQGPWKIHAPGALSLKETPVSAGHIASPDVHVDNERHEIRMYFHSPTKGSGEQMTFVALSPDGLHFKADGTPLCPAYLCAFRWGGMWYGLVRGVAYRSADGLKPFEKGISALPSKKGQTSRHSATDLRGDTLWVYWTNTGDAPEHIFRARVRLTKAWTQWKAEGMQSILRPELPREGADLPVKASGSGSARGRENALRDPAIFVDDDHRTYLLYSVAGESGIAIAELTPP